MAPHDHGIAAYLFAAQEEVKKVPLWRRALVIMLRATELGSLCLCFSWPCWLLKPWLILPPILFTKIFISGRRTGNFTEPFLSPLKMGFPSKYSLLGLVPKQRPAGRSYLNSLVRCFVMLGLSVWAYFRLVHGENYTFGCTTRMNLDTEQLPICFTEEQLSTMPGWVIPGPLPDKFSECKRLEPWWSNACNFLVADHCHFAGEKNRISGVVAGEDITLHFGQSVQKTVLYSVQMLFPVLACIWPFLNLVEFMASRSNPWTREEDADMIANIRREAAANRRGKPFKLLDNIQVLLVFADMATDLNSIRTYINLGHAWFALVAWTFFMLSFRDELSRGGPWRVVLEVNRSRKRGYWTDELVSLIRSEKTIEALPMLLLQVYAYPFCTSDALSFYMFPISILCSCFSVVSAMWQELDLGLQSAYPEHIIEFSDLTDDEEDLSNGELTSLEGSDSDAEPGFLLECCSSKSSKAMRQQRRTMMQQPWERLSPSGPGMASPY